MVHLGCYGNGGVSSPTLRPTVIKKEGVCVMSPCFLFLLPPPYLSCPPAEKLAPGSCIHLVEMLTCGNAWLSLKTTAQSVFIVNIVQIEKLRLSPREMTRLLISLLKVGVRFSGTLPALSRL